jgi:hypothetical protein
VDGASSRAARLRLTAVPRWQTGRGADPPGRRSDTPTGRRLERGGFVRRVPSRTDRRSVLVEPTPEGLRRVLRQYDAIAARSRATLASYPDEQVAALLGFIRASTEQARVELRGVTGPPS